MMQHKMGCPAAFRVSCLVLHMDKYGYQIPCPGYGDEKQCTCYHVPNKPMTVADLKPADFLLIRDD